MNARQRLLAACRCEAVDRPPLWLMRQAGRYLPEYRALRQEHEFWELMREPRLAQQVSLQPLQRFELDAAILFSDILIALDALGAAVHYRPGGPVIEPLIRDRAGLEALQPRPVAERLAYTGETVERLVAELHPERAVIGFAGAPFTLAAYLVEGGPARQIDQLKALAYNQPELFEAICDRIVAVVVELLEMQIAAGADMLQLFDTWAWHLSPADYERLALPPARRVIAALAGRGVPVALYLRNAAGHLEAAAASGCDVLAIDGSIRLSEARRRLGPQRALQGNLDPALLHAPAERIGREVEALIAAGGGRGHIVNTGAGLTPQVPPEGVAALVRAVHQAGR
jgi:uroporphyrinogen decarboxylase